MTGPSHDSKRLPATSRFERFTKALLAVPTQELTEQRAKYEQEKQGRAPRGKRPRRP